MRGAFVDQGKLFSYVSPEARVPANHPLRKVRELVRDVLGELNDSITSTGKRRRSAIDARTTRHEGYDMSQSRRAMIECIFGWGKQHGTMRRTKHRGIASVAADFLLNLIAYNLIRIPKLIVA